MSKRFRDATCVYCAKSPASGAGEHVFSRQFFAPDQRSGLPKVPTCDACNTAKSALENYVLTTIPLGNRSDAAHDHHVDKIPRRLQHNPVLHGDLVSSADPVWLKLGEGPILPSAAIPIDSARYDALFVLIARGLAWAEWTTLLKPDASITVHLPYPSAEHVFSDAHLQGDSWRRTIRDLGHGTIHYAGWQSTEEPQCTLWRISMLGGVVMGSAGSLDTSTVVGVITVPAEFERLRRLTTGA